MESQSGNETTNAAVENGLLALPEGCLAAIISFTTPRDACRSACVCTTFRSAADSDSIWSRFLPHDYLTAVSSTSASSKKDLYFQACHNPVLIHDGKLSFWLDKPSGKKCYMIAAKELKIVWGNTPNYYSWISLPEARFPEVSELRNVCWFGIDVEISTSLLSPRTVYVAYLVFKSLEASYGFEHNPVEVTVGLAGSEGQKRIVYLDTREQRDIVPWNPRQFHRRLVSVPADDQGSFPEKRGDGWFECELGEYLYESDDDDGALLITIMETKRGNWKRGLVFQGIEIRPKKE